MDHSWRPHLPPPPIQGRICPFCSISHFPFCPPPLPPLPPPPFPSNPSSNFHYPPPPPYQPLPPPPPPPAQPAAAPYDPFVDHRAGGPHLPPHPRTSDGYGNINPNSFEYNNVGVVNKRMRIDDSTGHFVNEISTNLGPSFDYGSVGVVNKRMRIDDSMSYMNENSTNLAPSFDYGNVGVSKRMRIDESTGQFVNEKSMNLGRFEADNERRLNLINEFGTPNHELDGGRYGHFDGFVGSKNSNSSYSYKDSVYGNLDRKQTFHDQDEILRLRYQSRESGYEEFDNNLPRKNGYKYVGPQDDQQNYEGSRYSSSYGVSGTNKLHHEQTSNVPVDDRGYSHHYSEAYGMQNHMESKPNHYGSPYDQRVNSVNRSGMSLYSAQGSKAFASQPPLPASPPPPLPMEPPLRERLVSSSPPGISASLFPASGGSSAPLSSSYPQVHEDKSISRYQANLHVSSRPAMEEIHMHHYTSSSISSRGSEHPLRDLPLEKSKVIDASHILKYPYRASRPDHLVIILRGLPGSGKSYLAKMLRDLEVENGGTAPRIYSMDEYFMTEVDKVEESEVSKSAGSIRGKKMATKKVMEYCYEPEMEEAYRSSMLKAFKKTLDEGAFSFVIVDDRNLRVADFAQFWATAKRSGYEVYLLEATYKDPAGCAARNVHGFTRDDVQKMAGLWEEAPSMYWKLDVKSLLHGDALEEGGIQEVDMDMEDDDSLSVPSTLADESIEKDRVPPQEDIPADGNVKGDHELDHEVDHRITETKDLSKSKWSSDLDEDDTRRNEDATKNLNALSGLIQSYSKDGKSVCWSDQVTKRGFSIGAAKATNVSLVIGPGAGYNLKSNPLPEEEKLTSTRNNGEPKRQNIFQERLRAERESFRAVFESFRTGSDKRRQRIIGLAAEDE